MPNHRHSRDSMVPKGTAPLECFPQMKKFKKKHVPNTRAGYSVAVCKTSTKHIVRQPNKFYTPSLGTC